MPLVVTFPHAIVFWLVFLWAFVPERTLVKNAKRASDPSLKVLLLTNQIGMGIAFAIAFTIAHGRIAGTGGLLMFVGIGLALGNWWSVAAATLGAAIGYSYRIHVEERALLATLGARYAAYAAGRKRLIPFVL
jgi:hypothetical protein